MKKLLLVAFAGTLLSFVPKAEAWDHRHHCDGDERVDRRTYYRTDYYDGDRRYDDRRPVVRYYPVYDECDRPRLRHYRSSPGLSFFFGF